MTQTKRPGPAATPPAEGDAGACLAPATRGAGAPRYPTARRRLGSEQPFGGSDEVESDHRGALYRLRITSMGKRNLTH